MEKLNIALLAGGNSSERSVSIQSAARVEAAFDRNKYNVLTIDVKGEDWHYTDSCSTRWYVDKNDFSLSVYGVKTSFDFAFIIIHGTPGEDGKLQGYLDLMGVPYSSGDLASTVITFDKALCKKCVSDVPGINLARGILLGKGDKAAPSDIVRELSLPLFVKPNASGSSFGVAKVKSMDGVADAVTTAFGESDSVLIEECIAGREFSCGVIILKESCRALPVTEIVTANDFFDHEAKYTPGGSDEITPAPVPAELSRKLQELACGAAKACRCRGVVRVDFIVTAEGIPYMIEVNSIPGMSAGSIIPKQLEAAGISMGELLDMIVENGL